MRLSMEETDPGYSKMIEIGGPSTKISVWLDGAKQEGCVTADEEAGFVLKCVRSDDGKPAFDKLKGEFLLESVTGEVKIDYPGRIRNNIASHLRF